MSARFHYFLVLACSFAGNGQTNPDPGGVLSRLTIAKITGSGTTAITAMAAGPDGSIYVTGTTTAPDLPSKTSFGEARIMRTTDNGATWTRAGSPPEDVVAMAADPAHPQILFATGARSIYKSVDGGVTWRATYLFPTPGGGPVVVDPANSDRIAVLDQRAQTLLRSTDGGQTWTANVCCQSLLIAGPGGQELLSTDCLGRLLLSRDWGLSFTQLNSLTVPTPVAAFDPSHPGWIYAGSLTSIKGSLWLSMDYGNTWLLKNTPSGSAPFFLAVAPDRPNTLVAGTFDGLYVSQDGGASWTHGGVSAGYVPGDRIPLALPARNCGGGVMIRFGYRQVAYSADDGLHFQTAHLSNLTGLAAGPGCTVYASRTLTSDVFVARLASDGSLVWLDYLGGSDADLPVGIGLDPQGNLWVAGRTNSFDFPVSLPRIGPPSPYEFFGPATSIFVSRFSSAGELLASVTIGGELSSVATGLAVDPAGNAYVSGYTSSDQFPVTVSGTAKTPGQANAVAVKFAPDASLVYSTYLPTKSLPFSSSAIAVTSSGMAIVAVPDYPWLTLFELDPSAAAATPHVLNGVSLSYDLFASLSLLVLQTDTQDNIYLSGLANSYQSTFPVTPGAYSPPLRTTGCPAKPQAIPVGNVFLMKIRTTDWQPDYASLIAGPCAVAPGSLAVDQNGVATVSLAAAGGLELLHPLVAGPTCYNSSAYARLSADGSSLLAGSYLDSCLAPALALAPDGSLLASVASQKVFMPNATGVQRLDLQSGGTLEIERVENSFGGDATGIVANGLYTLTVPDLTAAVADVGLNFPDVLPLSFAGVQVTFDGVPAGVFRTEPGRILVEAPATLASAGLTSLRVHFQGVDGPPVWMPVGGGAPNLLTRHFPDPVIGVADGFAQNADGTLNGPDNPAVRGSAITLFGCALSASGYFAPWEQDATAAPVTPAPVPGFIPALQQLKFRIPANLTVFSESNGVGAYQFGLKSANPAYGVYRTESNVINLYIR